MPHPDRQPTAPFPEKVGKYELLLPIGSGGMATVFLARSTGVGGFARDVALKLVHSHLRADEESKLHLLEEAKLSARIRHPNVVSVQEVDEDPFGLFLVMDYVEGDTLAGLERAAKKANNPLNDRLIARLLNDALLGLHAAHELQDANGSPLGIVHRDFTPQNILVSVEGITRLSDFGVAKAADRAVRTKTGLIKGKIAYMAPEQARGHAIDRRVDVWAAGVVAWELIARRRLYTSDDEVATLLRIVTERPTRLSEVLPNVSPSLDAAIAWALEPDLERRCPTAEALRAALEAAWNEGAGMADVTELSEFVRSAVGSKLIERQASIHEMRSLRLRIGEIARAAPDPNDSNPSNDYPWSSPSPATVRDGSGEVSGNSATLPSLPANHVPLTPPASSSVVVEPLTETSAVLPAFVDRTPTRIAWVMASLLGVVAVLFGVSQLTRGAPEPQAESAAPGPPQADPPLTVPPGSPAGRAATSGSQVEPASESSERLSAANMADPSLGSAESPSLEDSTSAPPDLVETEDTEKRKRARPRVSSKAASKPATGARAKALPPDSKPAAPRKPGLASSPYATQKSAP